MALKAKWTRRTRRKLGKDGLRGFSCEKIKKNFSVTSIVRTFVVQFPTSIVSSGSSSLKARPGREMTDGGFHPARSGVVKKSCEEWRYLTR